MAKKNTPIDKISELVKKVGDQAVGLQTSTTSHVQKHFTRRLNRVVGVRRFVAGWLALAVSLIVLTTVVLVQIYAASHTTKPVSGGTYTEGMVGSVSNLNPLFSSGVLDESTARLMFNGLLRYNTQGELVPDLASSWKVGDDDKTYTVDLRKDITWQDGAAFSAEDIVYTIKTIQNPATRSTQFSSWRGVTVSAPSKYQVVFTLPAPLAPFSDSLTLPIVPKHILGDIEPEMLRTSGFNTSPVGTGPFSIQVLRSVGDQQQLEFRKNKNYYRGEPRLDRYVLQTFDDENAMIEALKDREISAAVGLTASSSYELSLDTSIRSYNIPLYSGVYAFFKTDNPILSEVKVRTGLAQAIDRQAVLKLYDAQYPPLKTPLIPTQLGFNAEFDQETDIGAANKLLTEAGWVRDGEGVRSKDGAPLELKLVTVNSPEQVRMATELQKQWAKVGVAIKPQLLTPEQLQQNALATHDYDILLYGISIDRDPDVYAYWHSSQAKPGANNFSEWKSSRADTSLEVARTRLDPVLRTARYKAFQDEWRTESPAVGLYQLQTTYAVHQNTSGFIPVASTNAADRLTNVEDWTVNTKATLKTP